MWILRTNKWKIISLSAHVCVCAPYSQCFSKLMDRLAIKYLRRSHIACKVLEVSSWVYHLPLKTLSLLLLFALACHLPHICGVLFSCYCWYVVSFFKSGDIIELLVQPWQRGFHSSQHKYLMSCWARFQLIQVGVLSQAAGYKKHLASLE